MKSIIITLIVCGLTITDSFASVASDVSGLGNLAFGFEGRKFSGKNADELLKKYVMDEVGEPDVVMVTKEIEEMSFGEEMDSGFTSLRSAMLMGKFAEEQLYDKLEYNDNESEEKAIRKAMKNLEVNWQPLIKKLAKQGVRFAYSGNGPGYCGVSFIKLVVIDPNTGMIYDIYLSESGPC